VRYCMGLSFWLAAQFVKGWTAKGSKLWRVVDGLDDSEDDEEEDDIVCCVSSEVRSACQIGGELQSMH